MEHFPNYFESFDYQQMLRDFPLREEFDQFAKLSRDEIEAGQQEKLMRCIARAWELPFYQRLWGEAGIEPGDIRGLEDLSRLPIFSKSDLMDSVAAYPPFGDYHGWDKWPAAVRPVVVMQTTSGTTGRPQPIFFSAKAREVQALLVGRAYALQGLRPAEVVHSVYGHGMINGGHYVREAVNHYTNAVLLSAGTGVETRSAQQVALMKDFGVSVIVGFVDYIKRLADVAREMGLTPGVDIPVRMISGHIGRESRSDISAAWGGAEVYDWYGVGDTGLIASEAADQDGMYVMEDAHLAEICDIDTSGRIEGTEPGNLVVTCLYRDDIYPMIRFNTKDVSAWREGQSSLGFNLKRIEGFLGRSDNMVKIRGINIYPQALAPLLGEVDEFLGEYICRVRRDASGRDEFTVLVEVRNVDTEGLGKKFESLLHQRLGLKMPVELTAAGELKMLTQIEQRQKPIRLLDERGLDGG
jgi:phenylacetate-CoA ligase